MRRADVIVAAVLLLAATSLLVTWLAQVQIDQQRLACQNNLRQFYQSLRSYSEHHDNQFPLVEAHPPRNVAGIFVPILNDAGFLSPTASVACGTPAVPVRDLVFVNARVFFLGNDDFPADAKLEATRALNEALEAGWQGFAIAERYGLDEIARAHESVEHPTKPGRAIVTL